MKERIIKSILHSTIDVFIEKTHPSPEIADILLNKSFIAGGCIASLMNDEVPNDYDIYFIDKESADIIHKYYDRNPNYIVTPTSISIPYHTIQFIFRFYGTPIEVTDEFDFKHTTGYYVPSTDLLSIDIATRECILSKILIYTGSKYPLLSLIRIRKFIRRGWYIRATEMVKIAYDISELDMTDRNVLRDQFLGVDISTFMKIIDNLPEICDRNTIFDILDNVDDDTNDN